MNNVKRVLGDVVQYAASPYEALEQADGLVIATEWNEFRTPDFDRIKAALKQPVIFDGRNLFDVKKLGERGFAYFSIGRPAIK